MLNENIKKNRRYEEIPTVLNVFNSERQKLFIINNIPKLKQ